MIRVLIEPVGVYKGRAKTAIKAKKPEKIYLLIAKNNGEWPSRTKLFAKEIITDLTKSGIYEESDFKEVLINFKDPTDIFETLGKIIQEVGDDAAIWIDLTSTTRFALIWLERFGDLYENINYFIIPGVKSKDYSDEIINDPGSDPINIPKMATDIRKLLIQKKTKQGDVLRILNKFNQIKQARLLDEINWENYGIKKEKTALTRILKDLEGWGCIKVNKIDRINRISITKFGKALIKII